MHIDALTLSRLKWCSTTKDWMSGFVHHKIANKIFSTILISKIFAAYDNIYLYTWDDRMKNFYTQKYGIFLHNDIIQYVDFVAICTWGEQQGPQWHTDSDL